MTAIAGISRGGRVYLAADSAIGDGSTHRVCRDPKVWKQGAYALSECGDAGLGRVLAAIDWRDDLGWFTRQALDELVNRLTHAGIDPDACEALIGYRGRLYHYEARAIWSADAYDAAGSATQFLLGYLSAPSTADPARRVRAAVRAACKHVSGIAPPVRAIVV